MTISDIATKFRYESNGSTDSVVITGGSDTALVTKHVGTVGTSGTIAHVVAFDYGWE